MGKRSSGCITCRKRKVKCDETKPICERCKKATYKCQGYDHPWFNDAPYEREAHHRSLVRRELYRTRQQALLSREAVAAQGFLPADRLSQELNLSAFQESICRSFLFHRLCSGENFTKAISWWLNPAPRVEVQSRTLVSASKAMTAAFFGRIHQQSHILTEGTEFYMEALHNLNVDLSHKEKAFTFETLGATMALNMYELIRLTSDGAGCITHAGGIGKLIHARGPQFHKSYPEKDIYLEARIILVANAIFACQRTFLDEPKWKDVPWEDDPSAKTQFDYLVDVLSDMPRLLEEITSSNTPGTIGWPERPGKEALQKQLLERLYMLKRLREAWYVKYSNPLWEVPAVASASSCGPDGVRPPFDASIYFTNMWRAYEYCTFQINCLLLFLLYQDLSPENLQPVEDILPGLFPNGSVQNVARSICRCTDFLCHEKNGSRGYIVLQLPATIAYLAIEKTTPEAKWLYDVCKKRARSSGFGWGDFAMDQVTPLSQWMASCRDRHRDSEKSGRFSEECGYRPLKGKEGALVTSSSIATSPSEAALPMRGCRRPEEVVWHPP